MMKTFTVLISLCLSAVCVGQTIKDPRLQNLQKSGGTPFGEALLETNPTAAAGTKLSYIKVNLNASANPGPTDDTAAGYSVGSRWINTAGDSNWTCVDATTGAAVWTRGTGAGGGTGGNFWSDPVDAIITPDFDSTRNFGTTGTRFATGFLDALDITNNIVVGGTVDGRDIDADGTLLDLHVSDNTNPHGVTAEQAGALPFHDAVVDPVVTDDVDLYSEGTIWRNNQGTSGEADDTLFQLLDDTDGAAVWVPVVRLTAGGILNVGTINATSLQAGNLLIDEKPANGGPGPGQGEVWVKDDIPNTLYFTNDAGTDFQLGVGVGDMLAATYDPAGHASQVLTEGDSQNVTNKTIDGNTNTLTNLHIGNEVSWAVVGDIADRVGFTTGDKMMIFEDGVGMRKIDFSDLPGAGGGEVTSTANIDDNAIVRGNGGAKGVQDSGILITDANAIDFPSITPPAYGDGHLFYDSDTDSLTFYNSESEISQQVGQELFVRVRNGSGSTITKSTAVYVSGSHAGTGLPEVSPALANTIGTVGSFLGLAGHDIENNTVGFVINTGTVGGLNTSGFSSGDQLWVSASVLGGITATRPSQPNFSASVGVVTRSNASNGSIQVRAVVPRQGAQTQGALAFGGADGFLKEDVTLTFNGTNLSIPNNLELGGATDTTVSRSAAGIVAVEGNDLAFASDIPPTVLALTIDDVADGMDYGFVFVPAAFTISEIRAVHAGVGLVSPDVDIDIRHSNDRSAAGNQVETTPMTVTSSTAGTPFTTGFEDATVPSNSWIWVETSSRSGTTDNLEVMIIGTYD